MQSQLTSIFLFIVFVVSAWTARADQFQKFSQMPIDSQSALNGHSQATLNLSFDVGSLGILGIICSGVFVDPNGRVLTSLHCIEGCLMEKNAYQKELAHNEPVFIDPEYTSNKQFLYKIIPKISPGLSCSVKIGINGKKDRTVNAEVLHTFGPGFLYPRTLVPDLSEKFPSVSRELKNFGFEASGDLVLLKIPVQPESNCVQMDFMNFEAQSPIEVMNLAYPSVFRKTNNFESSIELIGNGETLLYSAGQVSGNVEYLTKIFGEHSKDQILDILPQGTFLSSIDAEIGASGSPLFSKEGKLIGIVRATYNFKRTEYEPWLTHGVSLNFHKDKLKELLPMNQLCIFHSPNLR